MNFFLNHLPENIMTIIVTSVTMFAIFKVTSFVLRILIAIALIAFLFYMITTYGPVMEIAPGGIMPIQM